MVRVPRGDELPESPETWQDIAMPVGPHPQLQWSRDRGVAPVGNDVRVKPDTSVPIVIRPPERPY